MIQEATYLLGGSSLQNLFEIAHIKERVNGDHHEI